MQLSYMATQHTVERHVTITAWSGRQEECARSSDARLFHFKKADSQLHTLCVYYEPWSGTWKRYSKIWGNLLALTAHAPVWKFFWILHFITMTCRWVVIFSISTSSTWFFFCHTRACKCGSVGDSRLIRLSQLDIFGCLGGTLESWRQVRRAETEMEELSSPNRRQ